MSELTLHDLTREDLVELILEKGCPVTERDIAWRLWNRLNNEAHAAVVGGLQQKKKIGELSFGLKDGGEKLLKKAQRQTDRGWKLYDRADEIWKSHLCKHLEGENK